MGKKKYSTTKGATLENTSWGKLNLYLAKDGKCEVFIEDHTTNEEKFLSFYNGLPTDSREKILAYIEMKMF